MTESIEKKIGSSVNKVKWRLSGSVWRYLNDAKGQLPALEALGAQLEVQHKNVAG
jgi:hypothetical protein